MTLEDLVYMIDGHLNVTVSHGKGLSSGISIIGVELVDSTGEPCEILLKETGPKISAMTIGRTEEIARNDLAEYMRGRLLLYQVFDQCKTFSDNLRIPPTLVGDKAEITAVRMVCPHTLERGFPIDADDDYAHSHCKDEGSCKRVPMPVINNYVEIDLTGHKLVRELNDKRR